MNILNKIFNWRTALYWHTVWFSLALLQQTFLLGQLWTITNVFVFILLLRCVYGPQPELANNCAICWYFYCLSVFTDLLSIAVFGTAMADSTDLYRFILASACMMFIPKPFFAVFLYKDLQQSGFSLKTGVKLSTDNSYQGLNEDTGVNPGTGNVPPKYSEPMYSQYNDPRVGQYSQQQQQQPQSLPIHGQQQHQQQGIDQNVDIMSGIGVVDTNGNQNTGNTTQ